MENETNPFDRPPCRECGEITMLNGSGLCFGCEDLIDQQEEDKRWGDPEEQG